MATYIVRTIETLRLVGIFAAKSPADLLSLVDDDVNPLLCEYLKLQDNEGIYIDALFTGTMHDDNGAAGGDTFCVDIETVDDAEKPWFTDKLAERLDRGRSWTAFTTKNFAQAFNVPLGGLEVAIAAGLVQ